MTTSRRPRCAWAGDDPLMQSYHDVEWGVPERNSRALWEMLMLEGFQAGLSWAIVLRKRDAFRKAFAGFNPDKVARLTGKDVARLLENPAHHSLTEQDSGDHRRCARLLRDARSRRGFC